MLKSFMKYFISMMLILTSLLICWSIYILVYDGWVAFIALPTKRAFYGVVLVSPLVAALASAARLLENKLGLQRNPGPPR